MTIKISELIGPDLDKLVAKYRGIALVDGCIFTKDPDDEQVLFEPSTNWVQGGEIIEDEEISIQREYHTKDAWAAWTPAPIRDESEAFGYGPKPLIAAMRCFLESQIAKENEVMGELC